MPLNFTGSLDGFPESAFFPVLPTLASIISALPGFKGAWDASDYSGAGPWLPRVAPATDPYRILPAGSVLPTRATRDGRPVLRFVPNSKAWVQDMAGVAQNFTGLTFATRAYYSNTTTNFQKIFDFGTPELFYRSSLASPVWQFAGLGVARTTPIVGPLVGWHRILFRKAGTTEAMLAADDADEIAIGGADALNNALQIGDASNSTSAEQDISRIIICNAGSLTTAQQAAVKTWVAG